MNFHHVSPANQHDLLNLLEENALSGWVNMLMTRQPSYLSGKDYFGEEHPVLAEENNHIVGCCQLTKQPGFINGQLVEMGYLNSLRVAAEYRHKIRVLKAGFNYLRDYFQPPQYCYTSIASDNKAARRLLESGIAGLPHYHFLGELCTLVISKQKAISLGLWEYEQAPQEIADFYNRQACQYQLSPSLTADWLIKAQLPTLAYKQNHQLQACATLWNQQAFKQISANYYHPLINSLRPLYNRFAILTNRPQLPAVKQILDQTFLAFFQTVEQSLIIPLIYDALHYCKTSLLTLSFTVEHPLLPAIIKAFSPLYYKTRLYGVDLISSPIWQQQRLNPEAAIL